MILTYCYLTLKLAVGLGSIAWAIYEIRRGD